METKVLEQFKNLNGLYGEYTITEQEIIKIIDGNSWGECKTEEQYLEYMKQNSQLFIGKINETKKRHFNSKDILGLKEKPTYDFVIDGIERGNISFLSGQGGAGKGFFILHMLFSSVGLTENKNFLFEKVKKTPTIGYFSFEDNIKNFAIRGYDCAESYKKDNKNNTNEFHFFDMVGAGAMFKETEEYFITEETVISKMKKDIQKNKIDLVIIDTLSIINQRYSENDNKEMAQLMEELKRFATETNTAIIIVHHQNKSGLSAQNDTNEGALRGAGTMKDNSRLVIGLEKCKIDIKEDNKTKKVFCKNWIEVRFDKANNTAIKSRIFYRHPDGVLSQMPVGYKVVDDLDITRTKNKVEV